MAKSKRRQELLDECRRLGIQVGNEERVQIMLLKISALKGEQAKINALVSTANDLGVEVPEGLGRVEIEALIGPACARKLEEAGYFLPGRVSPKTFLSSCYRWRLTGEMHKIDGRLELSARGASRPDIKTSFRAVFLYDVCLGR